MQHHYSYILSHSCHLIHYIIKFNFAAIHDEFQLC